MTTYRSTKPGRHTRPTRARTWTWTTLIVVGLVLLAVGGAGLGACALGTVPAVPGPRATVPAMGR